MNVLITGAAGFIGSNLVHYLAQAKSQWRITALDLLTYAGNLENISSCIEKNKIIFKKGDIAEQEEIYELFEKGNFNLVFHLAAESHVDRSIHSANEFVRTNVLGTQALLNAVRKYGVSRFVHVSTDEVYGSLGPTGSFTEDSPLNPTSPYAASKAASDLMVLSAHKTHGLDIIITRCTNNYGPYQFPEKFIPLFITNALENKNLPLYGDGSNVRNWLYVKDHCEALLLCAEKGKSGNVYNIGSDEYSEVPNKEVAKRILDILDKPESLITRVTDRLAHDWRYSLNSSSIRNTLGWKPSTTFEDGLASTIKWYTNNSAWWKNVKTGEYLRFYEKNYTSRNLGTTPA